jgi:hypothetical protein
MRRGKRILFIGVVTICLITAFVVLVGSMWDLPRDFSNADTHSLVERIKAQEQEIKEYGKSAAAFDADRYWPYDMNRTVLGMFLFREKNAKWPRNWEELAASGLVEDPSCIHKNWMLAHVENGWDIRIARWGRIARYRERSSLNVR